MSVIDSESRDPNFLIDDCTMDSQDSRHSRVNENSEQRQENQQGGTITVGDFLKINFTELGTEFARNSNGENFRTRYFRI